MKNYREYEEKLRNAQKAVAERHMIPVRLILEDLAKIKKCG